METLRSLKRIGPVLLKRMDLTTISLENCSRVVEGKSWLPLRDTQPKEHLIEELLILRKLTRVITIFIAYSLQINQRVILLRGKCTF